jgi:hypothetical protein
MLSATLLAGLTTLAAQAVNPGVVLQFEVKTGTEPVRVMSASVQGQSLKMDMPATGSDQDGQVIFRGDRREMMILNHQDKSVMVVDEAALKELAGALGGMAAQMQQTLANVPEAQRAMVEEMMRARGMGPGPAGASRPRPELRQTNERATHSGFATVKYEIVVGDRTVRELWVTPWESIDGHQELRPVFEAMGDFSKELMAAIAQSPIAAMASVDSQSYTFLAEMNGFPVVTRELNAGTRPAIETTLLSATRRPLNPDDFEPPADYRRQPMPGGQ